MAQTTAVSPLAPQSYPDLPEIEGVRFATAAAGIRYKGRTDVMLALFDKGTQVAGVFTRSKCPSAPVDWCRSKLKGGKGCLNIRDNVAMPEAALGAAIAATLAKPPRA